MLYEKLLFPNTLIIKHLPKLFKSGWQDSNLRPPAPKAGAIPGYATPRNGIFFYSVEREGFEPSIPLRI